MIYHHGLQDVKALLITLEPLQLISHPNHLLEVQESSKLRALDSFLHEIPRSKIANLQTHTTCSEWLGRDRSHNKSEISLSSFYTPETRMARDLGSFGNTLRSIWIIQRRSILKQRFPEILPAPHSRSPTVADPVKSCFLCPGSIYGSNRS